MRRPDFLYDCCHERAPNEGETQLPAGNRRSQPDRGDWPSQVGKWAARTCAIPFGIAALHAGLAAIAFPAQPAGAIHRNNYYKCTSELVDADVRAEEAERACSRALRPEDLAECVVKINRQTDISSRDALDTCSGVRRPLDLATCVVDISDRAQAGAAFAIMNNCRRSLLPARYSQCVVGLNRRLDISAVRAMDSCIDAGDRVRDLDPSFVPSDRQPLLPPPPAPLPANPATPL